MFRPALQLLLAALIGLAAPGCGFKGPLVQAPEQPAKKAPAAPPATLPAPQPGTATQ